MPQSKGQDDWEDLTPGSAASSSGDSSGDEWEDISGGDSSKVNLDPLTAKTQAAAKAVGAATVAPPPGAADIERAGQEHEAKQERLGYLQNRALHSPTPLTDASTIIYPSSGIIDMAENGGVWNAVKGAGKAIGRGALKSAVGSGVGAGVGGGIGEIVGHPKEGAQIGATIGGVAAPFAPDSWYSRAPYGIGRVLLGEEGLAEQRAASKLAQRNADIKAGLRKPPALPEVAPPHPLAGLPSSSAAEVRNLPALPAGGPGGVGSMTASNPRFQIAGPLALPRPAAPVEPSPDVLRIPEPRALQSTDRPGAMFSVPREQLPGLAAKGTPGAGDVLRNTGKTILYEPPSGYPGARSEGATRLALPAAPSADTLADAIVQRSGMDRPSAEKRAEELLNAISGKNFTSAERASARNQIRSLTGPR